MSSSSSASEAAPPAPASTANTTDSAAHTDSAAPAFRLTPAQKRVFAGLMIGMFVAAVSQMIVGPAMPRIVAELGGMDHYSWVATAAMLVSAITVPVIGKLSDLYGRRGFYIAGLLIFMAGSVICGLSQSFWMLVAGRAVQGFGMGTLMPLSQTIIGDIIPARQRGKYQGLMGSVFGLSSVAGPVAGGLITDHFGWRWLFFVTLPFGAVALLVILRFLHLPHTRREAKVDVAGILTLTVALVGILLATSWGGTTYAWDSAQVIGLYVVGSLALIAFLWCETRAEEPIIPLRLFRSRVVTLSVVSALGIAMVMFGLMIYLPVFAQGVIGVDATNSGLILTPLMLGMIVFGIVAGTFVSRTGHYKGVMILGVVVMGVGQWLLIRMDHTSSQAQLTTAMIVFGVGLGLAMQLYVLIVQNAVSRADLGVATASTQFFRNVGSTVGIAIFGTIMTSGLASAIAGHLSPQVAARMQADGGAAISPASVLDPSQMQGLPPEVAEAVRMGLAERLHDVYLAGFPILGLVLLATIFIPAIPLRETTHDAEPATGSTAEPEPETAAR